MDSLKRTLKRILRNPSFASFLIMIFCLIINFILQPNFLGLRAIKSNLQSFTPLILSSIAQGWIIISGSLDLSIGSAISLFCVLASYYMTDGNVVQVLGLSFVTVVVASGFLNGYFIGKLGLSPLIVTFATSSVFLGVAMIIMPISGGYVPKSFYGLYRSNLFGLVPCTVCILIISFGFWFIVSRGSIFRYIYAVGSNDENAHASGINVSAVRIKAHLIASLYICLAALCVLMMTATGEWRSGQGYTINSIAACVIGGISLTGGRGNLLGALFGALIFGFLDNIMFFSQISPYYQIFAKGITVLLAISIGSIPKLLKPSSLH